MNSDRITTDQQVAPFMMPGDAFALLFGMAATGVGHWLRTRREWLRQRRDMRQVRARESRILRDIGVSRWELFFADMQDRMER